ncbi:MAG: DUF1802 family protein, partial [Verrucomicrobiota bacterium]
ATVVACHKLDSLSMVERLRGQHIWRDEVIAQRFDWGKSKNINVLAVRVFRLPQKIELPMRPGYGGCKSWIELDREISINDATPVLDDGAFSRKVIQFQIALDPASLIA